MSKIVDLNSARDKKNQEAHQEDIGVLGAEFAVLADATLALWTEAMDNDSLNELIAKEFNTGVKDFANNLNALSSLEINNGINLTVFHPKMNTLVGMEEDDGFTAMLRIHDVMISSPSMLNENYARAFAAIYYKQLQKTDIIERLENTIIHD